MRNVAESSRETFADKQAHDGDRWAAIPSQVQYDDARLLPHKQLSDGRTGDLLQPPIEPAELVQARLFESMLLTESAHLNELANRIAGPLECLQAPDLARGQSHVELMQIHARIEEVHRLLKRLRDRFMPARVEPSSDRVNAAML